MVHDLDWYQEVVIVDFLDVLASHNDRLLVCRFLHAGTRTVGAPGSVHAHNFAGNHCVTSLTPSLPLS